MNRPRASRAIYLNVILSIACGVSIASAAPDLPPRVPTRVELVTSMLRQRTPGLQVSPSGPPVSFDWPTPTPAGVNPRNLKGTWSDLFGTPAVSGEITSVCYWGDSLVVGGFFNRVGSKDISWLALWDGQSWSDMGFSSPVHDVRIWKGQLIVSTYGSVEQWDGSQWEQLPMYGSITAIGVSDSDLIVGGRFYDYSGDYPSRIGRWNGSTWTLMGDTLSFTPYAITSFQGEWYAGGAPLGSDTTALARWDGTAWQDVPGLEPTWYGQPPTVLAMEVCQGELVVGGSFDSLGVARWNGSTWSQLPSSEALWGAATAMTSEGDSVLHIAGLWFGTPRLARWNGAELTPEVGPLNVVDLACTGSRLAAAGFFNEVDGVPALLVAERRGNIWNALEEWRTPMRGLASGFGVGAVEQLARVGNRVVASGYFSSAAEDTRWTSVSRVAAWDGTRWSAMGELIGNEDLVSTGDTLFAIGPFGVLQWNGIAWDTIGSGWNASKGAWLNGSLYVGESYFGGHPPGPPELRSVRRWEGSSWIVLPHPADIPDTADVTQMLAFGGQLIVAWQWTPYNRLTSWDGSSWTSISDPMWNSLGPLAEYGGRLYCGNFGVTYSDSVWMVRDGSTWRSTGVLGRVSSVTRLGPWQVVGGNLEVPHNGRASIAAWDGDTWQVIAGPDRAPPISLLGDGTSLWVGALAPNVATNGLIGRWDWDGNVPVPPTDAFVSAAPNPFSASVALRFSLARVSTVRMAIFDIAGHEVARLWNGVVPGGDHTLTWDGTDRHGHRAASGIYFARLIVEDRIMKSQRIALIR